MTSSRTAPAPALSISLPATVWKTMGSACQNGLPIYSPVDDDGRFAYTNDLPRRTADARGDGRQIDPGKAWQERRQRSRAARTAPAQSLAAPGELSSQLSALLAQQNAGHFPRDGSMVHPDRSRRSSARPARLDSRSTTSNGFRTGARTASKAR